MVGSRRRMRELETNQKGQNTRGFRTYQLHHSSLIKSTRGPGAFEVCSAGGAEIKFVLTTNVKTICSQGGGGGSSCLD